MSTLNPSRREVIAALTFTAVATGAVLAAASEATVSTAEWDKAVAAERAAHAEMEHRYETEMRPVNRAHDAGTATYEQVEQAEDAWAVYVDAHTEAYKALLATPAPTLAAALYKSEMADMAEFDVAHIFMPSIRADLRRFAKREAV